MNGPIAQVVALTCFGNAFLGGGGTPKFFPKNSTCKFCDSITFVEFTKPLLGKSKEVQVAKTPDEWFVLLQRRGATGIRLHHAAQNQPGISDRMSAGFVGGGGFWNMEVTKANGRSEFWAARWEVWNQNAPEQRIWRVTYGLVEEGPSRPTKQRALAVVKEDFRKSLTAIHSFSERQKCGGFTECFATALKALSDPSADFPYHSDIAAPNQLGEDAQSMLKASTSASVFGGMGSWNDMGYDGALQKEYDSVSEGLFNILNEAVAVSASSTHPTHKVEAGKEAAR